jgi:hypothetical protein
MIDCVDETNHKRTFKTPSEALEHLARREREGKPVPRFSVNGKPISVRRLKQLADSDRTVTEPERDVDILLISPAQVLRPRPPWGPFLIVADSLLKSCSSLGSGRGNSEVGQRARRLTGVHVKCPIPHCESNSARTNPCPP